MNQLAFTKSESKITFVLVLTFSLRLMGLFMLLPIFAVRAQEYVGATAQLTGIAAGIYGFPQAMLQLPFGYLSDKFGRKFILTIGFMLLALGSIICALATDIYMIILGRALQGAGAVGSVVSATIADNTRDVVRTRAMAFLGMAIGASFLLSIALGPTLDAWFSMSGIFWLTAIAAIFCMFLCIIFLPTDKKVSSNLINLKQISKVIFERKLVFFSASIMLLHAILSSFFLALPILMKQIHIEGKLQSYLYFTTLTVAMLLSYRSIYAADKKHNILKLDKLAILQLVIAIPMIYFCRNSLLLFASFLLIFFSGFCILEASMPSMVSKCAPVENRGLAIGFFSSAQFLGIFLGSLFGGALNQYLGFLAVIYFATGLAFVWLFMAGCFTEKSNKIEEL